MSGTVSTAPMRVSGGSFAPALYAEEDCPGHVASAQDAKVCARCGVHIDSFRPDDDNMEIE